MRAQQLRLPALRKLAGLIEGVGPGMLTAMEAEGQLKSRPMSPLELDNDGVLWFFVRASLRWEAGVQPVSVAFSQPDDACYVSVSGRAQLVRDRRKTELLWSSMATLWFAEGIDDPELTLLKINIDTAEYWDALSGSMVRLLPANPG